MLKIYDTNHNAIGHIVKYKDLKVASDVTTGDQTLSFTYMARHHEICEEYYIETQDAEYVVKEKSVSTDGFLSFVAVLNLEELEAKPELLWHYGFHNRRCGQACSGWIRLDGWRMYRNQEKKCRDIADKYAWSNSEAVYCIYV
ncbi:MAG: hypothetical protein ACLUO5_02800 [Ruminococcus sp.]